MINHPIKPIFDENSEILILGSFPSVKSRENTFYYAHPQNRFWKVMARICNEPLPDTDEDKEKMILKNHFALWDVIKSCEIIGSSDSSIKNVTPNDLTEILESSKVKHIFVNGKKAEALYKKYIQNKINISAISLPSTSPANAQFSEQRLYEYWNKELSKVKK